VLRILQNKPIKLLGSLFCLLPRPAFCDAISGAVEKQDLNTMAITMFMVFVIITLLITWWAAKRTHSRKDFYAAGGGIPAWQNGIAIAGDFLSAATFLGITSVLYFNGIDGLLLIVGVVGAWPIILFLIAERLRNLGRYTFIDVISFRLAARPIRIVAAFSSLTVVVFYLLGQLVGAGKLIQLLFGLNYSYAVLSVSTLMILYVTFGGMLATTWVQFIKALLLILGGSVLAFLVLVEFQFDIGQIFQDAVAVHPMRADLLAPRGWLAEPLSVLSVGLTLLLGFIGLPHILMRIFTVKDARAARKSSFYAIAIITCFNFIIILIGFAAVPLIMFNPDYHDAAGQLIGGRNMVVLHLTHYLGGDVLLGFISAVTFATILAVVSGLTLAGAATIAHDLYANTAAKNSTSDQSEVLVSRLSVIGIGILSAILGIAFEHQNVVFIATMALAIAGSVNAPILILSMYWPGLTARGALVGAIVGLVSSIGLIMIGPQIMVDIMGMEKAIFPYVYPTIVSAPLAFFIIWIVSISDNSPAAQQERAAYTTQLVVSELGSDVYNRLPKRA